MLKELLKTLAPTPGVSIPEGRGPSLPEWLECVHNVLFLQSLWNVARLIDCHKGTPWVNKAGKNPHFSNEALDHTVPMVSTRSEGRQSWAVQEAVAPKEGSVESCLGIVPRLCTQVSAGFHSEKTSLC